MSAEIQLSSDQTRAIEEIRAWLALEVEVSQTLTLGGYAGTGKTTVIRELVRGNPGSIAVCAFTGKAAYVLRQKGVPAMTMHRLIYQPIEACRSCGMSYEACANRYQQNRALAQRDPHLAALPGFLCPRGGKKTRYSRVPVLATDLVIVDEASMVNGTLHRDLESFQRKILYVGDHGQLEPIGENPRLMQNPTLRLEQIHRQAEGSAVIQFAHHVRQGYLPESFGADARVQFGAPADLLAFDIVLCGYNKTRVAVNARIRQRLGYESVLPNPGERVICLRNSSDHGVFNGMLATVDNWAPGTDDDGDPAILLDCHDDAGNTYAGIPIAPEQFGKEQKLDDDEVSRKTCLFDYGYCITVHKSQGSEFERVCVLEQLSKSWNPARWRYTAATRAAKELMWCLPR